MLRRTPVLLTCLLASVSNAANDTTLNATFKSTGAALEPPGQAAGPPQYEVEEIGSSAWGLTIPNDINNHGVIVGEWDSGPNFGDPRHAVVWINGGMIDLTPDPGYVFASARAVNDSGVVTGSYSTDGSFFAGGFTWDGAAFEVLPTFAPGHQAGHGLSERGFVLGRAMHEHFKTNATVWNLRSKDLDLGALGFGTGVAYDANGWDTVVGASGVSASQTDAFLWRDGVLRDIGALPGYPIGRAYAINNYDQIVGYSGQALDDHAVYWSQQTGLMDLGDLGHPYGASAHDINDAGVIAGYAYTPAGERVGAVWHDHVIHDLNHLLVNGQGWEIFDANGINELGQIVGRGRHNGKFVAYLLTPVATPMATIIGPTPGLAGKTNQIELVAATPGAQIRVLYGTASGASGVPECPGVVIDIANPRSVDVIAGPDGGATVSIDVPKAARGTRILFQAVDLSNCDVTNLIVRTMD